MKFLKKHLFLFLLFLTAINFHAQEVDITLFQQFNGPFDYVAFGNTMNQFSNGPNTDCVINTSSSADFFLESTQTIEAAYLYWAGSGSGDFEVTLNGTPIVAQREFNATIQNIQGVDLIYFGAFADVTTLLTATGNGTYTLEDLDLQDAILDYCGSGTNFGGWSVVVVFQDSNILNPNQQVNVFDGFESVSGDNSELTIELTNLNVLDNQGARIGFLAWEGDAGIANGESLSLNGNIISNPPLNPGNNQFNGTNSFTGASDLFNMDIDFYDIADNINPGDSTAEVQLTSNQDLVLVSNVVTVLNIERPDAAIAVDGFQLLTTCEDREVTIEYTVSNLESTMALQAGTSIGFFIGSTLVAQTATQAVIPINGSESGSITFTIPDTAPSDVNLLVVVDDILAIVELDELNNEDNILFSLLDPVTIGSIEDLELCKITGLELFDLTLATASLDPSYTISYYLTEEDAQNESNPIQEEDLTGFQNTSNQQTIWIRVSNTDCFAISSFQLNSICSNPDATIVVSEPIFACAQGDLLIEYTVFNTEGLAPLPSGTQVFIFSNGELLAQTETQNSIPAGGSEASSITISLPQALLDNFTLLVYVDNLNGLQGDILELSELNNEFEVEVVFRTIPPIPSLPDLLECDEGFDTATFNLTQQNELIPIIDSGDIISYYTTEEDAIANENSIQVPELYQSTSTLQVIYVRHENEICFAINSFRLITENCPPIIPEGMSPNGDDLNDLFQIEGLINVFERFTLQLYSRNGNLIYEGGNQQGLWDGIPNRGIFNQTNIVPVGTYYYVLMLNDSNFPDPFIGWVYVNY